MVLAPRPIEVTDVKELSAGERHFCALTNAGTVWCWGDNGHGQMGRRPASSFDVWIPAQIAGLTDVQSVTAGFRHTCAGHADGTVSCWGSNVDGQSDPVGWQSSVAMAIYDLTEPVVVRGCGE
jgi:alpha-tubulin suppressor-like RCC1 family protein